MTRKTRKESSEVGTFGMRPGISGKAIEGAEWAHGKIGYWIREEPLVLSIALGGKVPL